MAKYIAVILFCIADGLIILCGCAMVYVGVLAEKGDSVVSDKLNDKITPVADTVIACGVGVICVGALGLVSVILNHHLLIMIFEISMIITAGGLFMIGAVALIMVMLTNMWLREEMLSMMNGNTPREKMDMIETQHKCCGVAGEMQPYETRGKFPKSCCVIVSTEGGCDYAHAYKTHCDELWIHERDKTLWYSGFVILVMSALSVVMAFLVHRAERKQAVRESAASSS